MRDSAVVIYTGASANLVGVDWLNKRNALLRAFGQPLAKPAPVFASFRFGDGRVGDVHKAAILPISIVGYTGQLMAYVADAAVPDLLGKEALETLGGHLNFCKRVLTLEAPGGGYTS